MHTLYFLSHTMHFFSISLCLYNWSSSKGSHLLANVSSAREAHGKDSFLSA